MKEILDVPQRQIDERYIEYCGFAPRLGALVIDALIVSVASRIITAVLDPGYDLELNAILTIAVTIAAYLYYPLLEGSSGATIGKRALKIVVINHKFEVITYRQSFLRSIIRFLSILISSGITLYRLFGRDGELKGPSALFSDGLNSVYLVGGAIMGLFLIDLVVMLGDAKYQSLHDKIAGTYVVKASSIEP